MTNKNPAVQGNARGDRRDRGKALSPDKLRNTTAPRKTSDQPEDKGRSKRDSGNDCAGEARKGL